MLRAEDRWRSRKISAPSPTTAKTPRTRHALRTKPRKKRTESPIQNVSQDLDALGLRAREVSRWNGAEPQRRPPRRLRRPRSMPLPRTSWGSPPNRVTFEDERPSSPRLLLALHRTCSRPASGPAPMEEYEERAAMAKEVLRATSDNSRIPRRHSDEQSQRPDARDDAVRRQRAGRTARRQRAVQRGHDHLLAKIQAQALRALRSKVAGVSAGVSSRRAVEHGPPPRPCRSRRSSPKERCGRPPCPCRPTCTCRRW